MVALSVKSRIRAVSAFGLLLAGAAAAQATEVTIRVINAENGRPMEKQEIWLFFGKDTHAPEMKAITDSGGRAVFHIAGELPAQISAYEASYMRGLCSDTHFTTSEVLQHGVVPENHCDEKHKIREPIRPRPGEAVIFQRRPHWWEYID